MSRIVFSLLLSLAILWASACESTPAWISYATSDLVGYGYGYSR